MASGAMKANLILKQNIDAILKSRHQNRRDLARWVLQTLDKRADSWISHIFGKKGYYIREVPSQYLDRIADFLGYPVYQLFQPGLSRNSERRKGKDRRIAERRIIGSRQDLPITPIRQVPVTPEDEEILADLHALNYEQYQHVRAWIAVARFGPRNSAPDIALPDAPREAKSLPREPKSQVRDRAKKKRPTPTPK